MWTLTDYVVEVGYLAGVPWSRDVEATVVLALMIAVLSLPVIMLYGLLMKKLEPEERRCSTQRWTRWSIGSSPLAR